MYIRLTTISGASDLDAGVAILRDKVVPELAGQKGFRGLSASGRRSAGEMGILGMWATREDLEASESAVDKLRKEAMAVIGGTASVRTFEEVVREVGNAPPEVGNPLRVVAVTMDPSSVEENIEYFRTEVVPRMKATPGFRAVRNMMDRDRGEGMVGSLWADEDSMLAAEPANEERRVRAASRGVRIGAPTYSELLLMHLA